MSPVRVLDTLETDRLILRHRRAGEAAIERQLWTERDPRVPPHRRIDSYELLRAAHGCGYATGAGRAVVTWASEAGYRRLWQGSGTGTSRRGADRLCLRRPAQANLRTWRRAARRAARLLR